MENWKNYLVCVCTPTSGDDEGVYGTAVPVGPGLLLTARHVVRPAALDRPRRRHPEKKILIRWWYATDPDFLNEFRDLPPDDEVIVWENEKLDVALLRVPYPACKVGRGKCRVVGRRPEDGMRWESEGFPKVYECQNERMPQSCGGMVYTKADPEDIFEIKADSVERDGDWAGASGMPVVVDKEILGVVRQAPSGMMGARLHAAPAWKLLNDPYFRKLIWPEEDEAIRAAAISRLQVRLAADQKLLGSLCQHSDDATKKAAENQDVAAVVHALLELDLKAALAGLHGVWKRSGRKQVSIELLAIDVAAAHTSFSSVAVLRADHEYGGRNVVVTKLGTLTSAELAIAAWLGVDVALLPKRSEGEYPPGRYWIPLAPECGEDEGDRAIDAVCRDIEYRALEDFSQALDERLTRTEDLGGFYAPTIGRPLPSLVERKNVVRERFEDEAELGERCHYLAFPMPDNPEQRWYLERVIAGIRAFYAPVLALALDTKREREERRILAALRLMLPLEG